jgi:type II secretory pathway pseudopilin PulG
VEILIVVALLGVLVAIVTVSVLGLLNRGGDKAYSLDLRNIQTAVSSFYADGQTGFNAENHTWCDSDYAAKSEALYPTYLGRPQAHDLVLSRDPGQNDRNGNPMVVFGNGTPADYTAISQHAIWMGLIVNKAGDYPASPGGVGGIPYYLRGQVAPLRGQHELYINQMPGSASDLNGSIHSGGYTWIVGRLGRVYGVYTSDGKWYSGFNGSYP